MLMKSEHRKELVSEIRSLAQSQGLNTVFTTFLEITANSLAAQTDPENAEKREQRYQEMASTMTPELLSSYARMLALLFLTVREYRDDPCDILGGIYHELNLNNEWNGQYFTPDDVCRLMAQITLATVYKGNIIKNLIMDCQSYTKYRPNETTGGIFVSWRRKEELPTGA